MTADDRRCPPLDVETLLDELGGEPQVLQEVLDLLVRSTAESSDLIRQAYAAQDFPGLARSAHKLRGALVAFGAQPAAAAAEQLEEIGPGSDLRAASAVMTELQDELARLHAAVARIVARPEGQR